jgi:hypothetical protein
MKSYVYVYRVPALSVLAPEQLEKVLSHQGQFEDWRVLHVDKQIGSRFESRVDLIVSVDNDVYQTIKSDGSFTFDALANVLDFGQSLETLH